MKRLFEIFNEIQNKEKKALEKMFPNEQVIFNKKINKENVASVKDADHLCFYQLSSG